MNDQQQTAMILLVGEQPAPNLLPARHDKPDVVLLVFTGHTKKIAANLESLLAPGIACLYCEVHPYRLDEIQATLTDFMRENLSDHQLSFNLTGGTKPMALGAFQVARMLGAPFMYLQSEGGVGKLFRYSFVGDEKATINAAEPEILPISLKLDDYLKMYLGRYTMDAPREKLEAEVYGILKDADVVDEIYTSLRPGDMAALEIDFVIRCGNQFAIGEVKNSAKKSAIDQLNGVAQQRYLGTYIRKFLISGKAVDGNNRELATAYRTKIIELPSYECSGVIDAADAKKLTDAINESMGAGR